VLHNSREYPPDQVSKHAPDQLDSHAVRGAKATMLGHVEAVDMEAAIAAAAAEFGVPPSRILVQQVCNA
jgi:hypothetical protein